MYDFCPLSLYSGNREKMHAALSSLIRDPHRNLRIFVDGDVVHDELQQQICQEALCLLMFPSQNADIDTFVSVVYFFGYLSIDCFMCNKLRKFHIEIYFFRQFYTKKQSNESISLKDNEQV